MFNSYISKKNETLQAKNFHSVFHLFILDGFTWAFKGLAVSLIII